MRSAAATLWRLSALALVLLLVQLPAVAQTEQVEAPRPDGSYIVEKFGAQVPLHLTFVDELGNQRALGEYLQGRPIILNLGYYGCPSLCGMVLNGVLDALKPLEVSLGQDFDLISVSVDPTEGPELARKKRVNYLQAYGRTESSEAWPFLTGQEDAIRALAEAVGFGYRYLEKTGEYAHDSGVFVLTPDGRVAHVLLGVVFDSNTLKGALSDAAAGRIYGAGETSVQNRGQQLGWYRPEVLTGYGPMAVRIMTIGGIVMVVGLCGFLGLLFIRRGAQPDLKRGAAED